MRLLPVILALFFSSWLAAQPEAVIIYLSGKATYLPADQQQAKAVYPGARLPTNGSIRCEGEALLKLLYQGETFIIRDNKVHLLNDLFRQANGGSNIGFLNRFWSFITGSMEETKDEKSLEENHRRFMETVYAGVQGWAKTDFLLKGDRRCSGHLGAQLVHFRWKGMQPNQVLRFRLLQNADENQVLLSAQLKDSVFSLDLAQLALTPNQRYEWEVLSTDDVAASPRSERLAFVYNPEGAADALADLAAFQEYQEASQVEKSLMEAYALERAGFNFQANAAYARLLQTDAANRLVRDMYAAFSARVDDLPTARAMLQE